MRLPRPSALAAVFALGVLLQPVAGPVAPAGADEASSLDAGLGLDATDAVADTVAGALADTSAFTAPARAMHVVLISSGVDTGALPEALRSRVTLYGNAGDPVGYGTYAASVLLQLAPEARITSMGIYPGGRFQPAWQDAVLAWAAASAQAIDAVLFAVPPSEFLDPVSAAQASGQWDAVAAALSEAPLAGTAGPIFGDPLSGQLRAHQTAKRPPADRRALDLFANLVTRWARARALIQKLAGAGVAVVAPAGDLGPSPQGILGIANFPEVVTVGGFDGEGVSPQSSSGPSIDGRVKPDLLAPTGIAGLLPEGSTLARALSAKDLLDPSLEPAWDAGEPPTRARARLDSTMTAAAVVAVATGGMRSEGLGDVARQRGALTAASVPLDGVPAWRQGAGVLRRTPDAEFAGSRPLVTGHGDLGLEPDAGDWSTRVPVTQGQAGEATPRITDFVGVGPDAEPVLATLSADDPSPPVSARVDNDGVHLSLPVGDKGYEGGLYCGYTEVSLPGGGSTASPEVDADGIPIGVEQVPTCLVEGTRLDAFAFYIHKLAAEDLTFGLLPAVPAGGSLLHQPLHLLPLNPLDTRLFVRVTGADGLAHFPNIPPGYYKVRQWSDYGSPISQTFTDSRTGADVVVEEDLGENPAYQDFEALILSPVCSGSLDPATGPTTGDPCTREFLEETFGPENVRFEKTTATYLVDVGPATIRVAFGFLKAMPGPAVTFRAIDLVRQGDFEYLTATLPDALRASWLDQVTGDALPVWQFSPGADDPEALAAAFNPLAGAAQGQVVLGIAEYPFNLATPNYSMHMSLNFSYELTNAFVVPVVVVGKEVAWGVVGPSGRVQAPTVGASSPLNLGGLSLSGHGEGEANFEFRFTPAGAPRGTLYLVFVPPVPAPLTTATVGDLSFEVDTWTSTRWPPVDLPLPNPLIDLTAYPPGAPQNSGHAFSFDSRYPGSSPGRHQQQIAGACRAIDNGAVGADVCEDWAVLVHSPKDHAATFDLVDRSSGASLRPALSAGGAGFFDPKRGAVDFSHVLAFAAPNIPALEATLTLDHPFRANGRFWEQLVVPEGVFRQFPGEIDVHIQDYAPGRESTLAPHQVGPVPVAPYVPFVSDAQFLAPPALP